jgi:hypothetical protein
MHPAKGHLQKKPHLRGAAVYFMSKKEGFYIMRLGAMWW